MYPYRRRRVRVRVLYAAWSIFKLVKDANTLHAHTHSHTNKLSTFQLENSHYNIRTSTPLYTDVWMTTNINYSQETIRSDLKKNGECKYLTIICSVGENEPFICAYCNNVGSIVLKIWGDVQKSTLLLYWYY